MGKSLSVIGCVSKSVEGLTGMPESCTLYLCRSLNVPEVRLLYSIIQEFVNMCDLLLISFFISQACNCTSAVAQFLCNISEWEGGSRKEFGRFCRSCSRTCQQRITKYIILLSGKFKKQMSLSSLRQLDDNLIEGEPYNRLAQKIQRQLKWRVKI